jgi:acyl-CoA thioester hydrolase
MPDEVRFRFRMPIEVRWSDCDAFGHVNNAVYLTYLEQARFAYWHEVLPDVPFPGMIIARIEIDYRAQAYPRDRLEVRAAVTEMRRSSYWIDYEIVRADGTVVARARSAQVFFDYSTQRPRPIDPHFRQVVAAYDRLAAD